MLTVLNISELLNISQRQVRHYIESGELKASKKENSWRISSKDFTSFRNDIFEQRHKSKKNCIPLESDLFILQGFVEDIKNKNIPYEAFKTKYRNINRIISPLPNFIKFKRNQQITIDFSNQESQESLSLKYNLSLRSIKEITRKGNK